MFKRKGSAFISTVLGCSMFMCLISGVLAVIWNSDMAGIHNSKASMQAVAYCDDRIEQLKGVVYSSLPSQSATYQIDGSYAEKVEPLGNGQYKVSVYYQGESEPRASKILKRSEIGKMNYDVTDVKGDTSMYKALTQRLLGEEFAEKAFYVSANKDSAGNIIQVGNNKQSVYIKADGKPAPVDFVFRANNKGSVSANAKIAVVAPDNGIDYIFFNDLLSTGIKEQNYSREQGYVIFGNGMVLAYKNFYSQVNAGQLASVPKPINFTTYQAMGSDTSRGNEKTTARIVWQAAKSTDSSDMFKLDSNGNSTVKEYFSVFWVGFVA